MKIFIIGEAQALGPRIATYLNDWGHTVTVFASEAEANLPDGVVQIERGRNDITQDWLLSTGPAPEVVIVLPNGDLKSAELLREVFGPIAKRIVYCGSCSVYRAYARSTREEPGVPDLVPILEDDPLRITGDLPTIEQAITARNGASVSLLRLPELYGPGEPNEKLGDYVRQMDSGVADITIDSEFAKWRQASAYREDIALAVALVAKNSKAAGRTYNIADSFCFTRLDWINAIARAAEWNGDVLVTQSTSKNDFDCSQHLIVDSSRIRHELGYNETVPINEAIGRTVAWERLRQKPC